MHPIRRPPRRGFGEQPATLAAIQNLFARGEQGGYWPADPAYAYEDSAGTTPASVNGVVGLRFDVSKGLALGAITTRNYDFANGANQWIVSGDDATHTITFTTGSVRYQSGTTSPVLYLSQPEAMTPNAWNKLTITVSASNGGGMVFNNNGSITSIDVNPGSRSVIFKAGTTEGWLNFYRGNPNQDVTITSLIIQPILGNHAIQATTANKPYLRRTPVSNKYWLDSNTTTGALTATFASALGSACTIATVGEEGVTIAENQTVGTTYNICPPYNYSSDVLIINRALTAAEKALVTRTLKRNAPYYPSIVDARLQMRGYAPNNENTVDTSIITNFSLAWYGCSSLTSFPLINTAAGTNFYVAWYGCSGLTSFPLINTAAGTNFSITWAECSSLTSFPLINTAAGMSFYAAWYGCYGLTSFPANFFDSWTGVPIADCFSRTWDSCIKLTLASVQNIVVSLVVSGKSAPATGTDISLDGAPTLVAIQADTTVMTAVATLKSRNWTPKYKGTAL